jgi:hypothetical protein
VSGSRGYHPGYQSHSDLEWLNQYKPLTCAFGSGPNVAQPELLLVVEGPGLTIRPPAPCHTLSTDSNRCSRLGQDQTRRLIASHQAGSTHPRSGASVTPPTNNPTDTAERTTSSTRPSWSPSYSARSCTAAGRAAPSDTRRLRTRRRRLPGRPRAPAVTAGPGGARGPGWSDT